jgi:hypothetical protein
MLEQLFPHLERGIADLEILPFEPLFIEAVNISRGEGSLKLAGWYLNIRLDFILVSYKFDLLIRWLPKFNHQGCIKQYNTKSQVIFDQINFILKPK